MLAMTINSVCSIPGQPEDGGWLSGVDVAVDVGCVVGGRVVGV